MLPLVMSLLTGLVCQLELGEGNPVSPPLLCLVHWVQCAFTLAQLGLGGVASLHASSRIILQSGVAFVFNLSVTSISPV